MTRVLLQAFLDSRDAEIEAQAVEYARAYNVSLDKARRDVRDEYISAYADDMADLRNGSWQPGVE